MSIPIRYFDPQPAASELPSRMPSPFEAVPHPLARRAACALQAELPAEVGLRGKMFGVLVVADGEGRIGWLRGFSGMLGGVWRHQGWVPPLFDPEERDAFWPAGEAELDALEIRHRELDAGAERAALAELDRAHDAARRALAARHTAKRARRHAARRAAGDLEALAQESRADTAERRRLDEAQTAERAPLVARIAELDRARTELETSRLARSRALWARMYAGYTVTNARGERTSLATLFDPDPPPGGAGDCAAPKLLGEAYRRGLRPIAFAELWWGPPPLAGGRHAGVFYPACRGKCGVVVPWMLVGLDVDPAPLPGEAPVAEDQPRVVHEDEHLLVVDKPCGLLSVPGRHDKLRDSALVRIRRRHPGATVVHRLDLDTSGLLIAAKDPETHAALQRQFAERQIDKGYIALLDGVVDGDLGTISLPIRVDHLDRPRQVYDPVHGKAAVTEWRVLARGGARTRVAFTPRTGRTHQLRLHAAHPLGLGAPIVGDRIYGRPDGRLMLHAESLVFRHPRTGQRIALSSPAPF